MTSLLILPVTFLATFFVVYGLLSFYSDFAR